MNLKIETTGNIIHKVNVEMTAIEFMIFRHMLNLTAVHTELNETDSKVAGRMYKEIEDYLKGVSKCN